MCYGYLQLIRVFLDKKRLTKRPKKPESAGKRPFLHPFHPPSLTKNRRRLSFFQTASCIQAPRLIGHEWRGTFTGDSFLNGVVIYRLANRSRSCDGSAAIRTPPMPKSACRFPQFPAGDHDYAGHHHCFLFGLLAIQPLPLYRAPVFFCQNDGLRRIGEFPETISSRAQLSSSSDSPFTKIRAAD